MGSPQKTYDISRLTVLLVDDNKHMQLLLKEVLRSLNVRIVQTADDGADALKVLRTFDPDIIITDWNMTPLDGRDLVEMIRTSSDSVNPFVPIIMLTGFTEFNKVIESRDIGVHEYLAKPISAVSLYRRIVSIIENPRQFIKTRSYVGPDRRRGGRNSRKYDGPFRRKSDKEDGSAKGGGGENLSVADIDKMFD